MGRFSVNERNIRISELHDNSDVEALYIHSAIVMHFLHSHQFHSNTSTNAAEKGDIEEVNRLISRVDVNDTDEVGRYEE